MPAEKLSVVRNNIVSKAVVPNYSEAVVKCSSVKKLF